MGVPKAERTVSPVGAAEASSVSPEIILSPRKDNRYAKVTLGNGLGAIGREVGVRVLQKPSKDNNLTIGEFVSVDKEGYEIFSLSNNRSHITVEVEETPPQGKKVRRKGDGTSAKTHSYTVAIACINEEDHHGVRVKKEFVVTAASAEAALRIAPLQLAIYGEKVLGHREPSNADDVISLSVGDRQKEDEHERSRTWIASPFEAFDDLFGDAAKQSPVPDEELKSLGESGDNDAYTEAVVAGVQSRILKIAKDRGVMAVTVPAERPNRRDVLETRAFFIGEHSYVYIQRHNISGEIVAYGLREDDREGELQNPRAIEIIPPYERAQIVMTRIFPGAAGQDGMHFLGHDNPRDERDLLFRLGVTQKQSPETLSK